MSFYIGGGGDKRSWRYTHNLTHALKDTNWNDKIFFHIGKKKNFTQTFTAGWTNIKTVR